MLEVGEGAGGLELFMNEGHVFGRLDLVEHRRQFFIFSDDFLHRLFGDVRVACKHHGHRLADKMHLADGKDRLVVEGRAVIRLRDDLPHVGAGVDGIDAGDFEGGCGIDRFDAAVRHRAAENLGVQHAGQLHGVGIFGPAGDLFARLDPRQRATDLTAGCGGRGHQAPPPTAARTARVA